MVSVGPQGHHDHPPRDPRAMAPGRVLPVLALKIALPWRPAANRRGPARADPADGHREPTLGRATYPWRAAQTGLRCRSVKRRQVLGQTKRTALSGMAHLPA